MIVVVSVTSSTPGILLHPPPRTMLLTVSSIPGPRRHIGGGWWRRRGWRMWTTAGVSVVVRTGACDRPNPTTSPPSGRGSSDYLSSSIMQPRPRLSLTCCASPTRRGGAYVVRDPTAGRGAPDVLACTPIRPSRLLACVAFIASRPPVRRRRALIVV